MRVVIWTIMLAIAYLIGRFIGWLLGVVMATIIGFVAFGSLGLLAGVLNGTGFTYVPDTILDGVWLLVISLSIYEIIFTLLKIEPAVSKALKKEGIV